MLVSYQRPVQSHPSVFDWLVNADHSGHTPTEHVVQENPEGFSVTVDVPGVSLEGLSLRIEDRWVRLVTQRTIGGEPTQKHYRWKLPRSADADSVDATLSHGVLTLNVSKSESSQPREIEIKLAH